MQGAPGTYPEYETTSPQFERKVRNEVKRSKSFQDHQSDGEKERKYEYLSDSLQMPAGVKTPLALPEYNYTNGKVSRSRSQADNFVQAEKSSESGRHSVARSESQNRRKRTPVTEAIRRSAPRDMRARAYSDSEAENLSEGYPSHIQFRSRDERQLPPRLPHHNPHHYYSVEESDFLDDPRSRKLRKHDYRTYPPKHYDPYCPHQNSETTENEYYTPSTSRTVKPSKRHRRYSNSSSDTNISPWTLQNKILAPKYQADLEAIPINMNNVNKGSIKYLNSKIKTSNIWHDPLMGQDRKDAVPNRDNIEESTDGPLETFADFTGEVTINYLRLIWQSPEYIRKFIWSALFLGLFIYSFVCCFKSFSHFFSHPSTTKYNLYFEPHKLVRFPSITICNMNPHNKSYLNQKDQSPMRYYLYEREVQPFLKNFSKPDERLFKHYGMANYYRNSAMKLNDLIENVKFLEQSLGTSDAFQAQFTTHGQCWTFNIDGKRMVNRTGMDFGLSLELNIKQELYPEFVTTAGIKIMFHNYYEPALIDEYGMALSPGSENFISLSYERIKNLELPYGNCTNEKPELYGNYSVSGCERQCLRKIMKSECGCQSYYMKGTATDVDCTLYQEMECIENMRTRYHQGAFVHVSGCTCRDACKSENYKATLSTAEYPAKNYGEALERWNEAQGGDIRNISFYRENFIKVHIYFEILSIKEVEKVQSYRWSNLMGDVGGQLGLFLGANIVTVFEFVDYYARFFWYRFLANYMRKLFNPKTAIKV